VSVNLQGMFIFLFHCMRSAAVRSEWKSAFSKVSVKVLKTTTSDRDHHLRHRRNEHRLTTPIRVQRPPAV